MGGNTSSLEKRNSECCGTALIFSHKCYDPQKKVNTRLGTEKDEVRLENTLSKVGFNVKVYKDNQKYLTTKFVLDEIKEYVNQENCEDSCSLVVISSHGLKRGYIESYDHHYLTSDIWEPFKTCKHLQGKPKFFLFQACRGNINDNEERISAGTNISKTEEDETLTYELPKLPNHPDFFIAYSTVENRLSKRVKTQGTWYIQSLCKEIEKLQDDEDILSFMTKLNQVMMELEYRPIETPDKLIGQTPTFISFLHDAVYIPKPMIQSNTNEQRNHTSIEQKWETDGQGSLVSEPEVKETSLTSENSRDPVEPQTEQPKTFSTESCSPEIRTPDSAISVTFQSQTSQTSSYQSSLQTPSIDDKNQNLAEVIEPTITPQQAGAQVEAVPFEITTQSLQRNSKLNNSTKSLNLPRIQNEKKHKRNLSAPVNIPENRVSNDRQYDWEDYPYVGKAWLIHTEDMKYKAAAQKMEQRLKLLNFDTEFIKFNGKKKRKHFIKLLEEKVSRTKWSKEGCVLIAVFAPIKHKPFSDHKKHLEQCCINMTKGSEFETRSAWSPFLASKCKQLLDKPKLFFFIDTQYNDRFLIESDALGYDTSTAAEKITVKTVTEHADFLTVHGFDESFLNELCDELENCIVMKTDILNSVRNAMKRTTALEKENTHYRYPHLESTLRFQLEFPVKEVRVPKKDLIDRIVEAFSSLKLTLKRVDSSNQITEKTKKDDRYSEYVQANEENINNSITKNINIKEQVVKLQNEEKDEEIKELLELEKQDKINQQRECDNKLIIENIPHTIENLSEIFIKICFQLEIECKEDEIKDIRRLKGSDKIYVELSSVELRNKIIETSKIIKLIKCDIGIGYYITIYIHPFLTRENNQLFKYAKKMLKNKHGPTYELVTCTVEGKIIAKKTKSDKDAIVIKSKQMVVDMLKHLQNTKM